MNDLYRVGALLPRRPPDLPVSHPRSSIGFAALRPAQCRAPAARRWKTAALASHYKHTTLPLAQGSRWKTSAKSKVPDERTGDPVTRYLFEGETFTSRDEAEAVRNEKIVAKAREFYMELPAALAARSKDKLN